MTLNKLQRFAELKTFSNYFEFLFDKRLDDFNLKGKWSLEYFKNDHPLVLELGCGKGEYCIGLFQKFPDKNYIGVDIKGARIWRGAKTASENNYTGVAFLRTRIDFIDKCFAANEVDEIWITFPDPQLKKDRKRLTHPLFLNRYLKFLKPGGKVHLKTDSRELYDFTLEVIEQNKLQVHASTFDLYKEANEGLFKNAQAIQTFYESGFLKQRLKITYVSFSPDTGAVTPLHYSDPKKASKGV